MHALQTVHDKRIVRLPGMVRRPLSFAVCPERRPGSHRRTGGNRMIALFITIIVVYLVGVMWGIGISRILRERRRLKIIQRRERIGNA
jgi:hypothetical protein